MLGLPLEVDPSKACFGRRECGRRRIVFGIACSKGFGLLGRANKFRRLRNGRAPKVRLGSSRRSGRSTFFAGSSSPSGSAGLDRGLGLGLLFGFGCGLLLTLGFGRTGSPRKPGCRADTSAADGANEASFGNAFGALGQIGFARKSADGGLTEGFAQDFACCAARCCLPDATRSTADKPLRDAIGNAGRDLVAEGTRQGLLDVAVLNAPDSRADSNSEATRELGIDAFGGKTLEEFVDAARKEAAASADAGACCCACCCARKTADCANGPANGCTG